MDDDPMDDFGHGTPISMVRGMEWAVEHGCDAISMSMGVAKAELADRELFRLTCEAMGETLTSRMMKARSPYNAFST